MNVFAIRLPLYPTDEIVVGTREIVSGNLLSKDKGVRVEVVRTQI